MASVSYLDTRILVNFGFVQVLEIKAKCRRGDDNFVSCMRKALGRTYKEQPVAMGGVFNIVQGTAKLHVMVRTMEPHIKDSPIKQCTPYQLGTLSSAVPQMLTVLY